MFVCVVRLKRRERGGGWKRLRVDGFAWGRTCGTTASWQWQRVRFLGLINVMTQLECNNTGNFLQVEIRVIWVKGEGFYG